MTPFYVFWTAENDPHDGKRKCEALWPIFKIAHQKSRYIFDLYHRRKEISKELYEFCMDQGYADRNLIAKWKKVCFTTFFIRIFYLIASLYFGFPFLFGPYMLTHLEFKNYFTLGWIWNSVIDWEKYTKKIRENLRSNLKGKQCHFKKRNYVTIIFSLGVIFVNNIKFVNIICTFHEWFMNIALDITKTGWYLLNFSKR